MGGGVKRDSTAEVKLPGDWGRSSFRCEKLHVIDYEVKVDVAREKKNIKRY